MPARPARSATRRRWSRFLHFPLDIRFVYVYSIYMKVNDARRELAKCEEALRRLLAEAAGAGDYPGVLRITAWAKAVSALVAEGSPAQPSAGPVSESAVPGAGPGGDAGQRGARTAGDRAARKRPGRYPQFFRRGDELIKVGRSRKGRKEYHHRAARQAVDAVAAALRQIGANGKMFTGDKLLPLKDPAGGQRLPDYQAYVALAWLRQLGVVKQHGRRSGYTVASGKQVDSIITASWPELPEWRG
jgi:hypothetical protein